MHRQPEGRGLFLKPIMYSGRNGRRRDYGNPAGNPADPFFCEVIVHDS